MRLFFATDIHGSELCFKKFLRTPKFYDVDALFLGGDYTSKVLVVCVRLKNGWRAIIGNETLHIETSNDFDRLRTDFANRGQLVIEVSPNEFERFQADNTVKQKLFESAQRACLRRWTRLAEEQLSGTDVRIYHIPGNDEPLYCDEFFNDLPFVPVNRKHIEIGENLSVLGIGGSTPTPWHTVREYSESEIEGFIQASIRKKLKSTSMIFFCHTPPFASGLDNAPGLNSDFSYKLVLGSQEQEPVGSMAIRHAIEQFQPTVGLFGHVHEARTETMIGRTLCVNPGSTYYNARLQGCIVTIRNGKAAAQFTEG